MLYHKRMFLTSSVEFVFESYSSAAAMSFSYSFADDFFENETNHTNITASILDKSPCNSNPLDPKTAVPLCFINTAIFLLAVPGNLLVGWVVSSSKTALTPSDVYLFHLTIADGLMALTIPFSAISLIKGWVFGDFLCKLNSFVFDTNFYTSIIFLACISVDRYLVIVHASETLRNRKRMCSMVLCAAVWVLGAALSLPSLYHEVIQYNETGVLILLCAESFEVGSATSWRDATRGFHHIFGFLLPLVVMVTCYSITITRLLHTRGFQKHRAMKVIIVVVIAFLLCWTPYHLTTIVDTLLRGNVILFDCSRRRSVTVAMKITKSLALLHSCINPIIYAFIGERFRTKMVQLFQRKLRQERLSLSKFSRSTSQTSEAGRAMF